MSLCLYYIVLLLFMQLQSIQIQARQNSNFIRNYHFLTCLTTDVVYHIIILFPDGQYFHSTDSLLLSKSTGGGLYILMILQCIKYHALH